MLIPLLRFHLLSSRLSLPGKQEIQRRKPTLQYPSLSERRGSEDMFIFFVDLAKIL